MLQFSVSSHVVSDALPLDDYLALPCNQSWLIDGLIPVGGLVNLYGRPKLGKSFLGIDLARHIADPSLDDWLDFPVTCHGNILYVQLDTPRAIWIERFTKLQASGVTFHSPAFHQADMGQTPYPFNLGVPDSALWLRRQVDRLSPLLVVLDTIREAHQGDENDSAHMQRIIASLVVASRPAACLLISHSRKLQFNAGGTEEASLMDDNRGSGYVAGRCDTVLALRGKEGAPRSQLIWEGRAIEHGRLTLFKQPSLLWGLQRPATDTMDALAREFLQTSYPSMKARAAALSASSGQPIEKCRTLLRRLVSAGAETV